ncbi:hypothetical protein Cgig2_018544 [Carnegiea gigantea]|uniref:Uncharacterized protein n=1 Tax=Carnegiea gigantea TaxID=171969 RepID=A0A9Q1QK43_9CARY|nr:hypothetical protein Cgig2_018544 [Carnegiea gigantea]
MKVESRVQKAEENRMLILKSYRQERASRKEQTTQSLMWRMIQGNKYKECMHAAIHQKRRGKGWDCGKAHASMLRVQKTAKLARKLRAKLLREKKRVNCSPHASAKVLEMVIKLRGTTYSLAKAFEGDQLILIGSDVTLETAKSLLYRIEVHVRVRSFAGMENRDHLLKFVATPKCKGNVGHVGRSRGQKRYVSMEGSSRSYRKPLRHPMRVVLCAYMILGHPEVVLSGKGVYETSLTEVAIKFIQEFELLVKIILDDSYMKSFSRYGHVTFRSQFRSQLEAFDKAWRLYLYCFVAWKVKDANY